MTGLLRSVQLNRRSLAERISVFLAAMLVAGLVLLARDNMRAQYQRAMLVFAGCAWFIGFLMTCWLIARSYSTLLPAFVTLQAFGLLRAVERFLKPTNPGWG